MVKVCGELAAPGAVIVTFPLAEIPLTVTVCCCPLSNEPLFGDSLYAVRDPVALQGITPLAVFVTVNFTLDPRQTRLLTDVGATASSGWPGAGVTVAVVTGVTVPNPGVPDEGVAAGGDPPGVESGPVCAPFVVAAREAASVAVDCELLAPPAANPGRWIWPVALFSSATEPPMSSAASAISASNIGSLPEMRRAGGMCVRVSA